MERWPRKPPAGYTCDASIGVDFDSDEMPRVIMCPNPATETVIGALNIQAGMCEGCATSLEARHKIRRNPRRKK